MWRILGIVIAAAALGSLLASIVLSFQLVGNGPADLVQFVLGWSVATMLFTLPGAFLLFAIQAFFSERGLSRAATLVLILVVGTSTGAAILMLGSQGLQAAGVGALYGFTTAAVFVVLHAFWHSRPAAKSNV